MKKQVIQVTGDAVIDIFRFPRSAASGENSAAWKRSPGFSEVEHRGGSLLLADLIEAALPNSKVISERPECVSLISRVMLEDYKGIWRAASLDGFDERPCSGNSAGSSKKQTVPDIMVLLDAGNGFSSVFDQWPSALQKGTFNGPIILRLCSSLLNSPLIRQVQKVRKSPKSSVLAVMDADDLRAYGASVSRGLSWERTMVDFSAELLKGDKSHDLLTHFDYLIVRFGYEGVIVVDCNATRADLTAGKLLVTGSLIFDNKVGEGDLDRSFSGTMVGVTSVILAGLIHGLRHTVRLSSLKKGVRCGLSASHHYLTELGFGRSAGNPAYPVEQLGMLLRKVSAGKEYSEAELVELPNSVPNAPEARFSILEKQVPDTLIALAKLVVRDGNTDFTNVPKGKFGHLLTVERTEIENYRKIRNLMLEYLSVPTSEHPLCFAVFGPPGSGKSFGVKQLAGEISKHSTVKIEKVTFNLSEFQSPDELTRAFHQVRDITLKGNLPLVFFDEFDSRKDGQALFWLKYFLAPMQDGEFRDGETVHPIGKAIFVFAGGTCSSYEKFSNRKGSEFKDVKGPDFVSRLRGHLNIMGPNPLSPDDFGYIVRRALLLRNSLEQRAEKLGSRKHELMGENRRIKMDDSLLTAFLQVPRYRHGVRSMQAVIEMSAIDQGKGYRKSEVPAFDQLDMHVDAEAFIYLLHRDEQFSQHIEKIAKLIHKGYLDDLEKKDPTRPSHRPWTQLSEKLKKSNRLQAKDIPVKLSLYNIRIEKDNGQSQAELTGEEVFYLAQVEHRRWMRQEKETPTVPVHPCMVHWEKLSDEDQQKDISAIKRIPAHLKACGLVIVRLYPMFEKDSTV